MKSQKPKPFTAYCPCCDDEREFLPESFDYPAAHCNNGQSGIHYTGQYECEECSGYEWEVQE